MQALPLLALHYRRMRRSLSQLKCSHLTNHGYGLSISPNQCMKKELTILYNTTDADITYSETYAALATQHSTYTDIMKTLTPNEILPTQYDDLVAITQTQHSLLSLDATQTNAFLCSPYAVSGAPLPNFQPSYGCGALIVGNRVMAFGANVVTIDICTNGMRLILSHTHTFPQTAEPKNQHSLAFTYHTMPHTDTLTGLHSHSLSLTQLSSQLSVHTTHSLKYDCTLTLVHSLQYKRKLSSALYKPILPCFVASVFAPPTVTSASNHLALLPLICACNRCYNTCRYHVGRLNNSSNIVSRINHCIFFYLTNNSCTNDDINIFFNNHTIKYIDIYFSTCDDVHSSASNLYRITYNYRSNHSTNINLWYEWKRISNNNHSVANANSNASASKRFVTGSWLVTHSVNWSDCGCCSHCHCCYNHCGCDSRT